MSDNYGPNQSRVLDTNGRNLDNVVFLHRRPTLSSDWNLINQISNTKIQDIVKVSSPSGFLKVGDIFTDKPEGHAQPGQVLTSESYENNTFKMMSNGANIAVVNGWVFLVEGVNTPTKDNIIELNEPEAQHYDFVFLEVWRKLVGGSDPIYPYGNTHSAPYSDNEVEWDSVGFETSNRVQIQYRVRSVKVGTALSSDSTVFGDMSVRPIGGGSSESPYYSFHSAGPNDVGLWVSGDGTDDSKQALGTVDGLVYAIPMFLVSRRASGPFSSNNLSNTMVTKDDFLMGVKSDRPDGYLRDVVYREDIVDLRHTVSPSGIDIDTLMEKSIDRLLKGQLNTSLNRPFGSNGVRSGYSSGGSILTKVESIALPSGSSASRSLCNGAHILRDCIVKVPHSGLWVSGEASLPLASLGMPAGKVLSTQYCFSKTIDITGVVVSVSPTGHILINVFDSSNIIGSSTEIFVVFTYSVDAGDQGFNDIPSELLCVTKGEKTVIASVTKDAPVRFNNSGELLNFHTRSNTGTLDPRDFFRNRGGSTSSAKDCGHELVVHRPVSGMTTTVSLDSGKLCGHYIIGVKSVETIDGLTLLDFEQSRNGSPVVTDYTITLSSGSYSEVRVSLYTGSKPQASYGEVLAALDSTKYFKDSISGEGIQDSYETLELYAREVSSGVYEFDTGGKVILDLGTKTYPNSVDGSTMSRPFAYTPSGSVVKNLTITGHTGNIDLSTLLPVEHPTLDLTPTKIKFNAASGHSYLKVPVIVYSPLVQGDADYKIYYKCSPYQGLLSSSSYATGEFLKRGKAIITTQGSGVPQDVGVGYLNVIGRLPSAQNDNSDFENEDISYQWYESPFIDTTTKGLTVDFMSAVPNDFSLGDIVAPSGRGKVGVTLSNGGNPFLGSDSELSLSYGIASGATNKKVVQFYVMRSCMSGTNKSTGRLYLVAISSTCSGNDLLIGDEPAVDMFELVGRPLIK